LQSQIDITKSPARLPCGAFFDFNRVHYESISSIIYRLFSTVSVSVAATYNEVYHCEITDYGRTTGFQGDTNENQY